MRRPLNLARRPLRNERLPTVLVSAGCAALLAFSLGHALAARDVLPGRTTNVEREVVALEKELDALRAESADLGTKAAPADAVREWAVARTLVDGRAFSWTGLLASLEQIVPPGVRVVSIDPHEAKGGIEVAVNAVGRTVEDGLAFLEALQKSRDFDGPFLSSVGDSPEGIELSYTMGYRPGAARRGVKR